MKYVRETDSQIIDGQNEIVHNTMDIGFTGSAQTDTDKNTLEFGVNSATQTSGLISTRLKIIFLCLLARPYC